MKEEFTIKNIFRHWLKLWPVTVILVALGCGAGIYTAVTLKPSYELATDFLIQDKDLVSPTNEYLAIIDSDLTMKEITKGSCVTSNRQTGRILTIGAICESSNEAKELIGQMREKFEVALHTVYSNARVVDMDEPKEMDVTYANMGAKIKKFLIPVIAMFALSGAIAFIHFDYKTSKQK